jgi:hypothetical protein
MSAKPAKIFGIQLGIDPKIIIGLLVVIAGLVYYFNSESDDHPGATQPVPTAAVPAGGFAAPATPLAVKTLAARRAGGARNTARVGLKLVAIDGSRGDVDPTLRLDLLERVHSVSPAAGLRNLFEAGSSQPVQNLVPLPKVDPKMQPKPVQPPMGQQAANTPPPPPVFNIPLKYYGFAKPTGHTTEANRGLFLDGDNILMGGEGDILEKKYLIVALTPNSARLEDVQMKQGQDLPVTPAATAQ